MSVNVTEIVHSVTVEEVVTDINITVDQTANEITIQESGTQGPKGDDGADGVSDHTLLSNIGTNTHAQIDTALTRLANTSGANTGDQDLSGYELLSNKATSLSSPDNTKYPTTLAVQNAIDAIPTGGVTSFNSRTGAVLPQSGDYTKADVGLPLVPNIDTSTTANITDSINKRFVTDAEKTVIGNTSGTNTGDQDLSGKLDVGLAVLKSDYSPAHSILIQQSGTGSPTALQVGNNTLLGRLSGGGSLINDLSTSEVRTLLSVDNVDNTSDANKPVSTATQTALNLKENSSNKTTNFTGNTGSNTLFATVKATFDALVGYLSAYQPLLGYTPANETLSNLPSTSIGADLLPDTDGFYNIGASGQNWNNIRAKTIGYDGGTAIDLDTKKMFDGAVEESIDFEARLLKDSASLTSVQYGTRALLDSLGSESLNWESRYLADDGEVLALDYIDRRLFASDGTTPVIDWSSPSGASATTQSPGDNSTKIATTAYVDDAANTVNELAFGTGLDGNVTISSGTTTLTNDAYYNNLTISGTGKISTNGFRIYVKSILDISAAPAGAIEDVTTSGGNSGGTTAGAQAGGINSGTIGRGQRGNAAVAGSVAAGVAGGAASTTNTLAVRVGGRGGAGGLGASGAGGVAGGIPTISNRYALKKYQENLLRGVSLLGGGSQGSSGGSGGGDGTAGGGSGASGSSGGIVWIAARTINRGAGTAVGAIRAIGGNGGNGGTPAGGNRGGGAGGGAGAGGFISLAFLTLIGSSATDTLDVSGGKGGNGGNGTGTGVGGAGGGNGGGGSILLMNLGAETYSLTTGPVSVNGANAVGTVGGAGTAIVATQVSL